MNTTLQNTILAHNQWVAGFPEDCPGAIPSLGNNLIGTLAGLISECPLTLQPTDLTGDPGLGDFTDNGEPGNGHFPLLETSQAINAGNDRACPKRDQIGNEREGSCDIGSIEFRP
jgi:hypothetical protein